MQLRQLVQLGQSPRSDGVRLALLNGALAAFCGGSFIGTLLATTAISQQRLASGGSELPFPYPLLLLIYALIYPLAWRWFGRRLPSTGRERLHTALIGASPLFALSLLIYIAAAGLLIFSSADIVPTVFVLSTLSTLILLAGLACMGAVMYFGGQQLKNAR